MDEDPNILDLDYRTFNKITNILENPDTRNSLLEVLDPKYFDNEFLILMDVEGQKMNMTPAKYLLLHMGSCGIRVSHLCSLFEAINLEKALVLLKKEEPIRIIEQPPPDLKVCEGAELRLICRAESYPPAEYQWFKGEEELLLQQDTLLSIPCAKPEDSGIYCCQISKKCHSTNEYFYLYSGATEVTILPKDIAAKFPSCEENKLETPNHDTKVLCVQNSEDRSSTRSKEIICIVKQPFVRGRVQQGMSICLKCEAKSAYSISYRWFQNGRPLSGETSTCLVLNYLYPDPITGDTEWEYKCEVYNEYDHVFSRAVLVRLDDANEDTPYFAAGKKAFMVANDTYDNLEDLKKPASDVADLALLLSSLNFQIFAFKNLNLTGMKNAFHIFCQMLEPNDYALFFFAGHGFEVYGQTYLQPVDCSGSCLRHESICSEYILQCMQETKPAMNVLLIDACRNLPPELGETASEVLPPGKIFNAKMKNNTIYGYSTSFLYSSHESDSESNSVFVKYLKRHMTHNKKIQDVLINVQRDFESDILTKNLQFPMIKSTLTASRKLCDPVCSTLKLNAYSDAMKWTDVKRGPLYEHFHFTDLRITIILEMTHHMNTFCNGVDVNVYFDIKGGAFSKVLNDMEVDVLFSSSELRVFPVSGNCLKFVLLNIGEKTLVLKKQVLDLHKIKTQDLKARILLKFCSIGKQQEVNFSIDTRKLAELELSQLKSYNIENLQETLSFKNHSDDENTSLNSCSINEK